MMADDFNHFGAIGNSLDHLLGEVVRATAVDGKKNIQQQIQANGQVDTGFMLNSVYTVTTEGSDYTGGEEALPPVGAPEDETTAYIGVAAEYGAYQNYGTRFIPPRPFFEPALEITKGNFQDAVDEAAGKLGGQ